MSKTLLPKVVSTRVVNKARFLSLCEVVKRIKMFAQVNRPPCIHILAQHKNLDRMLLYISMLVSIYTHISNTHEI
jgi:hypothetical protein